MSKKANPGVIGAFVLAAIGVAFVGILFLGSGKLFSETERFVLYFQGNLSGLDIGAPVEYAGIRIGEVVDMYLEYNTNDKSILIPVYIEIEPNRIKNTGSKSRRKRFSSHIENGLRAQLQSQSLITGKIKIMLMLDPKQPLVLVGADSSTVEIPTIPSLRENLGRSLHDLPIADIFTHIDETMGKLAEISDSGEIQAILHELRKTSEALSAFTKSEGLQNANQSLSEILTEFKTLVKNLNQTINPAREDLTLALKEFAKAAQATRYLMDYLERHPESLIHGKGVE